MVVSRFLHNCCKAPSKNRFGTHRLTTFGIPGYCLWRVSCDRIFRSKTVVSTCFHAAIAENYLIVEHILDDEGWKKALIELL